MLFARTIALILLGGALLRADDITLTDGTVLRKAKIISHDNTSAMISFEAGVAKVKLELIPPMLLEQPILPNFPGSKPEATPIQSAEKPADKPADKAVAIPDRIKKAVDAGQIGATGTIAAKSKEGLMVFLGTQNLEEKEVPHREQSKEDIVPDGTGRTAVQNIKMSTWTTKEMVGFRKDLGLVFVACDTHDVNIDDDKSWQGAVWHVGKSTFTDAQNVPHEVDRYTTYPEEAYAYFAAHPDEIPPPRNTVAPGTVISQTPVQTTRTLSVQPLNPQDKIVAPSLEPGH